jgi:hypothetical protein
VVLMLLFVAREAVSDVVYGDPPKNLPWISFLKFVARCCLHCLCSTPGNTTSNSISKPLQASVCIANPRGWPITLRKFCKNRPN